MKTNDNSSIWKLVIEGKANLSDSDLKDLELTIDKKLKSSDIADLTDEMAFRSTFRNSKKKRRMLKNIRLGALIAVSMMIIAASVWIVKHQLETQQELHATQTNVANVATLVEKANRETATASVQQTMSPTMTSTPTATLPVDQNPVPIPLAGTQRIDFDGRLSKEFCEYNRKICFVQGVPELADGTYAVYTNLSELELPGDGKIPLNLAIAYEPNLEVINAVTPDPQAEFFDLRNCDLSVIANPCFLGVLELNGEQEAGKSFGIRYKEQIPTSLLNGRLFTLIRLPEALSNLIGSINGLSGEIVTILLPLEQVKNTDEIAVDCASGGCDEKLMDHYLTNTSLPSGTYNLCFFTQKEIDTTKCHLQLYQSDAIGNRNLILDLPFTETSNQYGLVSNDLQGQYEIQVIDEMNNLLNLEDSYLLVWK